MLHCTSVYVRIDDFVVPVEDLAIYCRVIVANNRRWPRLRTTLAYCSSEGRSIIGDFLDDLSAGRSPEKFFLLGR